MAPLCYAMSMDRWGAKTIPYCSIQDIMHCAWAWSCISNVSIHLIGKIAKRSWILSIAFYLYLGSDKKQYFSLHTTFQHNICLCPFRPMVRIWPIYTCLSSHWRPLKSYFQKMQSEGLSQINDITPSNYTSHELTFSIGT